MQSCARRLPQSHPKPYQSPLWEHLETIRALRRKHQTWAAIALHLKESHGLKTTSASVLKFFKRAATGRVPIGFTDAGTSPIVLPESNANTVPATAMLSSSLAGVPPNPEPNEDPLLVEISGPVHQPKVDPSGDRRGLPNWHRQLPGLRRADHLAGENTLSGCKNTFVYCSKSKRLGRASVAPSFHLFPIIQGTLEIVGKNWKQKASNVSKRFHPAADLVR